MTNKMVERITRSFESQSMMKTLGAMIHQVEKGNVIIDVPLLPSTLQQQGYVHAGLTFSIWRQCRVGRLGQTCSGRPIVQGQSARESSTVNSGRAQGIINDGAKFFDVWQSPVAFTSECQIIKIYSIKDKLLSKYLHLQKYRFFHHHLQPQKLHYQKSHR